MDLQYIGYIMRNVLENKRRLDSIPSVEERILDVLKEFHPNDYSYLTEQYIRIIISQIVYNTKIKSVQHYEMYQKNIILIKCLSNLEFCNKQNKLKYKHALAVISLFARKWKDYYYNPINGKGFIIVRNNWTNHLSSVA